MLVSSIDFTSSKPHSQLHQSHIISQEPFKHSLRLFNGQNSMGGWDPMADKGSGP